MSTANVKKVDSTNAAHKYLLVVDDSPGIQRQLRWAFDGFHVLSAGNRGDAIDQLRRLQPGVVLLDLGLPPDPGGVTEGLATLQEILALAPETRVIVITGDNDRANAVSAVDLGAHDYFQKPVDPAMLAQMVARAYSVYELECEGRRRRKNQRQAPLPGILASSPAMLSVCRTARKVAATDVTILLRGASGSGKERFARAIHELSRRCEQKMVAINCAAIPAGLLESELFGYEKGAFTGATARTIGKIEHANGGTLFLDEIGDMPMALQSKLLRFLAERVLERVGGRREIPVDVRLLCATHQNLEDLISAGRFREDLYYRISDITLNIPGLSAREGDVQLLAKEFLSQFSGDHKRPLKGFNHAALASIERYAWPGNVRELENRVRRAAILAEGAYITPEDLELDADNPASKVPLNLRVAREDTERRLVERALALCDNNIAKAAGMLGIARPTLYKLIHKYELGEDC